MCMAGFKHPGAGLTVWGLGTLGGGVRGVNKTMIETRGIDYGGNPLTLTLTFIILYIHKCKNSQCIMATKNIQGKRKSPNQWYT